LGRKEAIPPACEVTNEYIKAQRFLKKLNVNKLLGVRALRIKYPKISQSLIRRGITKIICDTIVK